MNICQHPGQHKTTLHYCEYFSRKMSAFFVALYLITHAVDRMRALERVVDETLARRTPEEVAMSQQQWCAVRQSLHMNGFSYNFAQALGFNVRFSTGFHLLSHCLHS